MMRAEGNNMEMAEPLKTPRKRGGVTKSDPFLDEKTFHSFEKGHIGKILKGGNGTDDTSCGKF